MAAAATAKSGMLMISVARVTERDNSNPPCDLSRRRGILGRLGAPDQAVRRPRNPTPGLSPRWQSGYQAEAATKKSSWPSNWPGRMAIIARYSRPVVDMKERNRQVASARPAATSGRDNEPRAQSTESTGLRLRAWVSEPEPRPTPPRVSGTTTACSTRLIRSTPIACNSRRLVSAGVTRYQCPSNMPVVAAPRTAAETAIMSAIPAPSSGDPASGQKAATRAATRSTEAASVTVELAADGPLPRKVTTAFTIRARTKHPIRKTRALAAGWFMGSRRGYEAGGAA